MAHALTTRKNGKTEMAYVGDTPWHGLGQALTDTSDIELWKREAGMDWKVARAFPRFAPYRDAPQDEWVKYEDAVILFRDDTHAPLATVSPSYKVVQPGEVLEFFRDLVGTAGFKLSTAGTLDGGRRFWAMADIGDEADVLPGDKVRGRLLLSSSCDGNSPTIGKFISERVVCANTLAIAMRENGNAVRMTHRQKFDAAKMRDQLNIGHGQFAKFMENARWLADVKLTEREASDELARLLTKPAKVDASAEESTDLERLLGKPVGKTAPDVREGRQFKGIMRLFQGEGMGADLKSADGTAWGLVNAVTQYVDWQAQSHTQDSRVASSWFGQGDDLKSRAFAQLLDKAAAI